MYYIVIKTCTYSYTVDLKSTGIVSVVRHYLQQRQSQWAIFKPHRCHQVWTCSFKTLHKNLSISSTNNYHDIDIFTQLSFYVS